VPRDGPGIAEEDLSLDVCSEGELVVASAAVFPPAAFLLHGNGKTPAGAVRRASTRASAGSSSISAGEASSWRAQAVLAGRRQRCWSGSRPAWTPTCNRAVDTGTEDQKFGLSIASGEADQVARSIRASVGWTVGDMSHRVADLQPGCLRDRARRWASVRAGRACGAEPAAVHAVPYRPGEQGLDIAGVRWADQPARSAGMRAARHGGAAPHHRAGSAIVGSAG